ncbi:MAG: glycoside hydrolase family 5 protein [Lachnospiraceae bacterium]|nr:glycoside hydrolase family 5 protein [Lachnospiraceae bacterium]
MEKLKEWRGYRKGVNLGGWFSQCRMTEENYQNFIRKDDFAKIAGWGCDHVRLPIDFELLVNPDGSYIDTGFAHIQRAIDWSKDNGLNIILDLHKADGYSFDEATGAKGFFDSEVLQEKFYDLWEHIAQHFGALSDHVAFELLNEVTDRDFCERWNRILTICIGKIRKIAPVSKILIGGYWNNSINAVADLPEFDDDNIIYNFHCYSPIIFTHQGATWIKEMPHDFRFSFGHSYEEYDEQNVKLFPYNKGAFDMMPDKSAKLGQEYFEKQFGQYVDIVIKRGKPLYCGEYGVIDLADAKDSLEWYKAINATFEKFGIGRAAWSYRGMNFGLEGAHYAPVIGELVNYL